LSPRRREPDFDDVLGAAARLQGILDGAVLVGGTAAAHHAGHRVSFDDDHVLTDLRQRYDEVLDALESTDGWATARVQRPVLILGNLDGIETGVRQLVRRRPLEVEEVTVAGKRLRVPTLAEMARVKGWLVLRRNATRDYLDVVALAERLGPDAARVLAGIDAYYEDQAGPGGRRVATQLAKQLAEPAPYDLSDVDLRRYRRLDPRWQEWARVVDACGVLAAGMLDAVAGEDGP
jgi:hypothetical protein